jgi:uncharacterized protein (DUF952 family)
MSRVYKVMSADDWRRAEAGGAFTGAAVDLADGYIHLSTADQVAETLRRHFAGRDDLVLVGFEAEALGAALKWEPSRGGALFPHLYGPLPSGLAASVAPLARDAAGAFVLPEPIP